MVEITNAYLREVMETFRFLETQREKLEVLVEMGKELGEFPSEFKIEANKVPGCVSGVYVEAVLEEDETVKFYGCSESFMVRGYVAILVTALSGRTSADIIEKGQGEIEGFVKETNIAASLVASRANAFGNILKMMVEKVRKFV